VIVSRSKYLIVYPRFRYAAERVNLSGYESDMVLNAVLLRSLAVVT
jgi:hypothetical protein